jgi:protein-S-isoprenylcysteine O-methyltransferase Ste14
VAELLDALGVRGRRQRQAAGPAIAAAFAITMVLVAAMQARLEQLAGLDGAAMAGVVAGVWLIWTIWHSIIFPRNRRRFLDGRPYPYRWAFLVDIFGGITVGFSQMLRPWLNGETVGDSSLIGEGLGAALPGAAAALALLIASTIAFAAAWVTLGTARVGFVHEYVPASPFQPVRHGIYGIVRHPLFWSGAFISASLAMWAGTTTAYAIAGINLAYAVAYNRLEDRRLRLTFGDTYSAYASQVSAILPRLSRRPRRADDSITAPGGAARGRDAVPW